MSRKKMFEPEEEYNIQSELRYGFENWLLKIKPWSRLDFVYLPYVIFEFLQAVKTWVTINR